MDLMTLMAKIQLDSSGFEKGVRHAESMGQQLTGKISAMTVAAGQLVADLVRKGISGIEGVIGGAIDGYADYQQLIGGVETLFKGSADKVAKYAKQSFKTTGLSANDYMETVTSFSASLLQGLKGDTDQAAEYANMAIIDMADNANKMGTDMSSIQAAYQGFAKQNYTMLDNLKLGYGGTREEMVRLINDSGILSHEIEDLDGITFDQIVLAIHEIQKQMGITGTTAQEAAETISGSKNSLKAAWEDLLSAVGGEGDQNRLTETLENFKTSFSTYMENYLPALVTTITNSGSLVDAIADAISDLPTTLLTDVAESGLEAGTEMIGGVSKITHWLIESISNMFKSASADPSQIADLGVAIGDFLGSAIADIVTNAPAILEGIVNVGVALSGGLIEGLFKGLFGEGAEVDKITKALEDDLVDIDVNNAEASGILKYMEKLNAKFGFGVEKTEEWKEAQKQLENVLPGAGKVFEQYGSDVGGALRNLERLNEEMRQTAIISGMEKALKEARELYGEQMATAAQAQTRADIARDKKTSAESAQNESAVAFAREILKLAEDGTNFYMGDREDQMLANARKTLETGTSDKISELIEALENYYDKNDIEDEGTVWGKSDTDNILSPEAIAGLETSIKQYDQTIKDNEKIAKDSAAEAAETQKEIDITQQALNRALADAGAAAESLANRMNSVVIKPSYDESYMPKATGMDYVPYDGFRAELHRGEAIVPASENKKGSGSVDLGNLEARIENAIRSGMAGATVNAYMNGRKVTEEVNRNNINAVKDRRFRG